MKINKSIQRENTARENKNSKVYLFGGKKMEMKTEYKTGNIYKLEQEKKGDSLLWLYKNNDVVGVVSFAEIHRFLRKQQEGVF